MHDPIICLISSFREAELIQGTIRSLLPLSAPIIVFEGSTEKIPALGVGKKTDLGRDFLARVDMFYRSEWASEADKRNAMLGEARARMGAKYWILTLDADEILVWAEYLPDWLNALRPGYPKSQENIVPIKVTVPGKDDLRGHFPATYLSPSRLVHSTLLDHYEVGLAAARTPDGALLNFSTYDSELPPLYGEPHIHHRYYLRRGERGSVRRRGTTLEGIELQEAGLSTRNKEQWEGALGDEGS